MIKIATSETAQVWASEPEDNIVQVTVRGHSDWDANFVGVDELRFMLPLFGYEFTAEGRELLSDNDNIKG